MTRTLNNYIAALNYADKALLIFSDTSSGVSFCLFTTVICTLIVIAKASIDLVFLSVCDWENAFENNEIKKIWTKGLPY